MKKTPIGYIPSSYGRPVPAYRDAAVPDGFVHDIDGCMDIAGIYHASDRQRCKAQIEAECGQGGIRFEIFLQHGGRKVPRVSLRTPREPVYPRLPRDMEPDVPVEAWVTLALEQPDWASRAAALLDIIGHNLEHTEGWDMPPDIRGDVQAIGLALLLTATLEHLVEPEIDCLEAAAFYALTMHPEWSAAGTQWLEPFRDTWFAEWTGERPAYRRFAALRRNIEPTLPAWIVGGAA